MTPESLLAELERHNVKVSLAGDRLRLDAPAGVLTQELKELLSANKQELVCHLTWQSMLDRANKDYRPGALAWCRQHFPGLWGRITAAEDQFQAAFWEQDMEGVRRAAEEYESTIKRIVLLYNLGEDGEMKLECVKP